MIYKELDPEVAAKAIEGYQNELAPESKALDAFYRQFNCPNCKGACQRETVVGNVFADPDTLVPRACLRCTICRCLFDPHSDLLIEGPDPHAHVMSDSG